MDRERGSNWSVIDSRRCEGLRPGEVRQSENTHPASEGQTNTTNISNDQVNPQDPRSNQNPQDQERNRREMERNFKDKQRMVKEMERSIKEHARNQKDVTKLQSTVSEVTSLLSQMEPLVSASGQDTQKFWDLNLNFDDKMRDFWDVSQQWSDESRDQENEKNTGRTIKDKERMIGDMERECRQRECKKELTEKIKSIVGDMKSAFDKKEFERFWDLNRDIDDAQREFWDRMRETGDREDTARWTKDIQRELKDRGRMIEQLGREVGRGIISKDVAAKLTGIFDEMKRVAEEAAKAVQAKEYETARELMEDKFRSLREDFEEVANSLNESREKEFGKMELQRTLKEIDYAEKQLKKGVESNKIDKERAAICQSYIDQGRSLIQEFTTTGNEELSSKLESIGEGADRDCAELMSEGHDYEGFNDVYVDKPYHEVSKDILERVASDVTARVLEHIGKNSSAFNDILAKVGGKYQEKIAQTLEATSFVSADHQEELLNRKGAILEQIKEMEELTTKLESLKTLAKSQLQELQGVKDQIANYNFIGSSGADIEEELASFVEEAQSQNLGREAIQRKVRELKSKAAEAMQKSRQEKFEKGVIGFLDADDNEWFGRYALMAKEKGWVKGTGESGYTQVNPGADTNVAEALTMIGRVAGARDGERANSAFGRRLPEWAQSGAAALEDAGVDLKSILGNKSAADTVSRGEVARLLQNVFHLESGDTSSFADVSRLSAAEREAVGAVRESGIMTGEGDGSRFNAGGDLNRAALMKILSKASEVSSFSGGAGGVRAEASETSR